jgi:hypothetical protein
MLDLFLTHTIAQDIWITLSMHLFPGRVPTFMDRALMWHERDGSRRLLIWNHQGFLNMFFLLGSSG